MQEGYHICAPLADKFTATRVFKITIDFQNSLNPH